MRRAPWIGLLVTLALIAAAFAVPSLLGWQVYPRATLGPDDIEPLHGLWEPKWFGPGTIPAVVIAVLGWRYGPRLAERLTWARLQWLVFAGGLAWFLALAFVDGPSGISRVLGNPYEYLPTAREVDDVHAMLREFIDRIPYAASPDNWPTHVAGHPPGALLVFIVMERVGLGGDFVSGLVVTVLAATIAPAVLSTLRTLDREAFARVAAPFLALTPAAVFLAVSADALFTAVAVWGLAALARAATTSGRRSAAWSVLAGLLLGACVMLSYGLPLLGIVALGVLWAARSWKPLIGSVAAAVAVVLAFAVFGFRWWEAYPVLHERYNDGVARIRPFSFWVWGNLAALALSIGPAVGAALGHVATRFREIDRTVLILIGSGVAMIAVADLSGMSKAEVERIWLPFMPWLTLALATLPPRWRNGALALQLVSALLVQHVFYTSW